MDKVASIRKLTTNEKSSFTLYLTSRSELIIINEGLNISEG